MIKKNLFIISGFKIVWLSCVFGEVYLSSLFGFFIGAFFLLIYFFSKKNKIHTFKVISFFSLIGYFFDSLLSFFELYNIEAEYNFIFLPLWFLILWPSFCCLLVDVLIFLKNKTLLSISLGGIFGPLSYYAGISAGIASFSNIMVFLLISIFWALIMFVYSKFF